MSNLKIAVCAAGNAGYTLAGDLALQGLEVNLLELPRFEDNIRPVMEKGVIEVAGACRNGFAKLNMATTNLEKGLKGVKVILFAMPAYGHVEWTKACAPYIEEEQIIVLNPEYTLGSVEVAHTLSEEGVDMDKVTVGATNCLIYYTRRYLPNRVWCLAVKHKMPFATFPAKKTMETVKFLNQFYPQDDKKRGLLIPVENVLKTSLGNINPVGHVPLMILQAPGAELGKNPYTNAFNSKAWRRMRKALAKETLSLQRAYGLKPESQNYIVNVIMYPPRTRRPSSPIDSGQPPPKWVTGATNPPTPRLYKPDTRLNLLKMRYMTEDVPYGLVGISGLGDLANIPTPVTDAAVTIASTITGSDFWKEGRNLKKLGLADMKKEELIRYLNG